MRRDIVILKRFDTIFFLSLFFYSVLYYVQVLFSPLSLSLSLSLLQLTCVCFSKLVDKRNDITHLVSNDTTNFEKSFWPPIFSRITAIEETIRQKSEPRNLHTYREEMDKNLRKMEIESSERSGKKIFPRGYLYIVRLYLE